MLVNLYPDSSHLPCFALHWGEEEPGLPSCNQALRYKNTEGSGVFSAERALAKPMWFHVISVSVNLCPLARGCPGSRAVRKCHPDWTDPSLQESDMCSPCS